MTTDEFVSKYNGKTIGYNGYVGECLSLVKQYIKEVYGIEPPPSGVNSAWGYWTNFPNPLGQVFEKVPNTPNGVPKKGDIIIWNSAVGGGYGHIAIFIEGNASSFKSFDQNWGGRQAHIQGHYYNNVLGWLTPRSNMNGLKLFDNNGQVWAVFDNKQFYVENPKSIEGLSIVKGQPSGEILIKQKDQDARLAQLRSEMQGQIDARDVQISNLNSKIEQLKKQNSTLVTQNSEYNKEVESIKELFEDCQTQKDDCVIQKDKLQKQIDEHKCVVKEMTAWEHFKMFISKLIERK